jgi:hypothetical protein
MYAAEHSDFESLTMQALRLLLRDGRHRPSYGGPQLPQNGDINKRFGVYQSLCCGQEIVIPAGASFPDCPKHPRRSTNWKPVADDRPIPHGSEIAGKKKKNPDHAA